MAQAVIKKFGRKRARIMDDGYNPYELSSASVGSHQRQPMAHRWQKRLGASSAHLHKYAYEMPKQRQFLDAGLNKSSAGAVVFGTTGGTDLNNGLPGSPALGTADVRASLHFEGASGWTSKQLGSKEHSIQQRIRIAGLDSQASQVEKIVFGNGLLAQSKGAGSGDSSLRCHPAFCGAHGRPSRRESPEVEHKARGRAGLPLKLAPIPLLYPSTQPYNTQQAAPQSRYMRSHHRSWPHWAAAIRVPPRAKIFL